MATIKFLIQSQSENAPIYLRLSLSRLESVKRKTGLQIYSKDWSKSSGMPKQNNDINKELHSKLRNLENKILDKFNEDYSQGKPIDGDWLSHQIDLHFKRVSESNYSEFVLDVIKHIVDTAHIRENAKGGIGLSSSRKNSYGRLSDLFKDFQGKNKYKIKDLNKQKFEEFKSWLFNEKKYAATYALKKLSDLKTVCKEARALGIETSYDLADIKTKQVSAYEDDMDVIYLTLQDIEKIEKARLISTPHINARKWLIMSCFSGQRGNDLVSITHKNFKKHGNEYVINLIQKKGNKPVVIPVLPKVKAIYETELPYHMTIKELNKYFKEIGKIAEVNDLILGRLQDKVTHRGVKKIRPKYKYLSSHIGRRSFASNHYGIIPTPIIMQVTNHKKESTFLSYVNKSDSSHIDTFLDYYKTQVENTNTSEEQTII